jgi:hypothetical protein
LYVSECRLISERSNSSLFEADRDYLLNVLCNVFHGNTMRGTHEEAHMRRHTPRRCTRNEDTFIHTLAMRTRESSIAKLPIQNSPFVPAQN